MADFERDDELEEVEELVVVMTDEEGNEYYYREDMIIPVGEKRFAILVPLMDDDCECGADSCGCGEDETDVFIARIDTDENGEDIYVDPTDEEFEAVRQAYEELVAEEDMEA